MITRLVATALCGTVAAVGCATKSFVQERVTAAESKFDAKVTATEASLGKRAETQETKLRDTAERTDAASERLKGLDTRVGEVDAVAGGARARAEQAAATAQQATAQAQQATAQAEQATAATQDAEARLAQRLAGRNRYRVFDTKAVYFDSGRMDIRKQDIATLDEVAKVLAADPNAILEVQGFADTQGTDRYNRDLARERVEVVMRYLMQQHNIELRQLHGLAMGKVALGAGEKATPQMLAEARRVDLRVLTPWSSWEERSESPTAEAPSALPIEVQRSEPPPAKGPGSPARQRMPESLRSITPQDLGAE